MLCPEGQIHLREIKMCCANRQPTTHDGEYGQVLKLPWGEVGNRKDTGEGDGKIYFCPGTYQ